MAPQERKSTQRERLLRGIVQVANRNGYAGASVSAVIEEAGVSRPTFYDYFADRNACFTAAIEDVQTDLLDAVLGALEEQPSQDALAVAVRSVVQFAAAHPARARFLMGESMSGGRVALDARDEGIARAAQAIERARAGSGQGGPLSDLEPRVVLGSVYRMLATRFRRAETSIVKLTDELLEWLASYEVPSEERRWQTLKPTMQPTRSSHLPDAPIQRMPNVFPPGRPRLSESEIAENHRLRVLWAAARLAEQKGYLLTKVADITKLARVDGQVFYRLFSDKQEAFTVVHELGFQEVMNVTAKAFFSVSSWPARSWEAGAAFTQLLQENKLVANLGFVEAYAIGPSAVQRIEDNQSAFLFFLQEGLMQVSDGESPSRLAMEAVISSVFELVYLQARRSKPAIAGMLPYIAHLWLTPFLGVDDANAFIDERSANVKPPKQRRGA